MVYDPAPRGDVTDGEIGRYFGIPKEDRNTQTFYWSESITLFDDNKTDILECITTIHHENGHRQSHQKPNVEGGWGETLSWDISLDQDYDCICDLFEPNPTGTEFSVETEWDSQGRAIADCPAVLRDQRAWNALAHGESGFCTRNEAVVNQNGQALKTNDWSFVRHGEIGNE